MTEDPTVEPWWDNIIEFLRKRERTARLRKEIALARAAGKERRHQERLRRIEERQR